MSGVYWSTDGGETWLQKNCSFGDPTSSDTWNDGAVGLGVHPTNPDIAIVGIRGGYGPYRGGIYRSIDAGDHWEMMDVPGSEQQSYWNFRWRGSTVLFFGRKYDSFPGKGGDTTDSIGFMKSDDDGLTWAPLAGAADLIHDPISHFDVSANGSVIHAALTDEYTMKSSYDGGATWESVDNGAGGPVSISPNDSDIVLFATYATVLRSDGDMENPSEVLVSEGEKVVEDIDFAPSDPSVVYVATAGYQIYRSDDGGKSFSAVKNLRHDVLAVCKEDGVPC